MFGMSRDDRDFYLDCFQRIPRSLLSTRYPKDGGVLASKYLESGLRLWQIEHAQYNDRGQLLARPNTKSNALLLYVGLKPTSKKIEDVEPWQVIDHYVVGSNFDLLYTLLFDPTLDESGIVSGVREELGTSVFWAVALVYFSGGARSDYLLNAYINHTQAVYSDLLSHQAIFAAPTEAMKRAYEAQLKRTRTFVRTADKLKAQVLREKTDAYRRKHPKRSRNAVAKELANDKEIGLGTTRIKEYFLMWFDPKVWPNSPAGRRPRESPI